MTLLREIIYQGRFLRNGMFLFFLALQCFRLLQFNPDFNNLQEKRKLVWKIEGKIFKCWTEQREIAFGSRFRAVRQTEGSRNRDSSVINNDLFSRLSCEAIISKKNVHTHCGPIFAAAQICTLVLNSTCLSLSIKDENSTFFTNVSCFYFLWTLVIDWIDQDKAIAGKCEWYFAKILFTLSIEIHRSTFTMRKEGLSFPVKKNSTFTLEIGKK